VPKNWAWAALPIILLAVGLTVAANLGTAYRGYAFLGAMAVLAGELAIIGWLVNNRPIGAFIDNRNKISLSKLQAGAWTVVVLSALATIAVYNLLGQGDASGTTDLEITSDMDEMTDSSDKVSNQDCLGAMFGAEEPVYEGSGWTAVRDVVAREPDEDNDHWIEQTAVIYPEASNANRFLEKSKSSWQKCVGSSLAVDTSDTSSLWEFGDVTSTDGLIAQVANQEDADGWGCQHALAAAS